jgi:hypothetical protein
MYLTHSQHAIFLLSIELLCKKTKMISVDEKHFHYNSVSINSIRLMYSNVKKGLKVATLGLSTALRL